MIRRLLHKITKAANGKVEDAQSELEKISAEIRKTAKRCDDLKRKYNGKSQDTGLLFPPNLIDSS